MDYQQTLDYIHARPKLARELGNAKLRVLLDALGNPHKKLKFVHLAGTNGKGSTAAMIAAALQYGGCKTGLFVSPFIERFNERIQIDGCEIADDALARAASRVRANMERTGAEVSEFAFVFAVGVCYFAESRCDIVVLETGMGGLLDATNVIDASVVSILTLIGMDHMQYLGETIEEIARTKCGIIKENGVVVSYPCQRQEVMQIIREECDKKNAELIVSEKPDVGEENTFIYSGKTYQIGLEGVYQPYNAATALAALTVLCQKGFFVSEENISRAIAQTCWKARFERVDDRLIIDGSHNIDGMRSLRASLERLHKRVVLVMAMMRDKDYEACVREIAPVADLVIATCVADMPRSLTPDELAAALRPLVRTQTADCAAEALRAALAYAAAEGAIVCTCGSLYLAGEARRIYLSKK